MSRTVIMSVVVAYLALTYWGAVKVSRHASMEHLTLEGCKEFALRT